MVLYCVTISLDPTAVAEWTPWMRDVHIPEVLATGYFEGATMLRVLEPAGQGRPTFEIQYRAPSLDDLREYQANAAPFLQEDHARRFAGKFWASRRILTEV